MSSIKVLWEQPSHKGVKALTATDGARRSVSTVSLPAGAHFGSLEPTVPIPQPDFSTLQTGPNEHVELKSDLVFCNHSCEPSLEFDTATRTVRVARDRPLREGDDLTFFYPSTEWDMDQPFQCSCNAGNEEDKENRTQNGNIKEGSQHRCLGLISGAKQLDREVLEKYWLNPHIVELLNGKA